MQSVFLYSDSPYVSEGCKLMKNLVQGGEIFYGIQIWKGMALRSDNVHGGMKDTHTMGPGIHLLAGNCNKVFWSIPPRNYLSKPKYMGANKYDK